MDPERSLEQRLGEIEALLRTLVIRVTELELQPMPARPTPQPEAPPAQPLRPVASTEPTQKPPAAQPPPPPKPTPAPAAPVPTAAAPTAPAMPKPAEWRPAPKPPKPPGRSFGDLARDWDLVGARGFAIAGGAVMALGIGLFFVLAANRGWINEEMRVALGATASALVFGAGLLLRARYGQYWSALAAVGAGIAGAYATVAAAAARYDVLPDSLALPLAGVIAAAGTVVAIRWRSQVIAAIGLLGAALAPALQAIDTEMTWESAAFAVIVLVAAGWVSISRGWHELLITTSVLVGAQVEWLAADAIPPVNRGTVAVVGAFVLSLLGIAVGRQIAVKRADLDAMALSYALASFGAALVLAAQLLDERTDRGVALLAAAVVWALVFVALQWRRLPDLGLVVGASALALAAVGTADMLSDSALTIAWAGQAVLLAALARRLGDARLQSMGIGYAVLASVHALGFEGRPDLVFDELADHLSSVLPLAASAAALISVGVLIPREYRLRTEAGLLAFVGSIRWQLIAHRHGLREAFVFAGGALATLSASFALVSASFQWGHVAASIFAALVGATFLGVAGRLRSDALAIASLLWLGVVLAEAAGFDVSSFEDGGLAVASIGGWSVLAASAGLLGGSYALRVTQPDRRAFDVVCGISVGIAFWAGLLGVGLVAVSDAREGIGFLALTLVYGALAAGVFRVKVLRDFATTLWALGLVSLVWAEILLISDHVCSAAALSATAFAVGVVAQPLRESRLWLAGGSLAVVTSAVVLLYEVQPWLEESELAQRLAIATAACALATFGLAALRWGEARWRDLVTALWVVGILALLSTERVLLGDDVWLAATVAATAFAVGALAQPLRESRLWLAGGSLAVATSVVVLFDEVQPWLEESELAQRLAIATAACALATFGLAALRWGEARWRDLVTVLWVVGILALLSTERVLLGGWQETALAVALTGGAIALLARPLGESRLWFAGGVAVGATTLATIASFTPPSHFFNASASPAAGIWVLAGCILALVAVATSAPVERDRVVLEAIAGGVALYAVSLGILEIAERVSTASVETDFERGHTAVSGLWALVGLALLIVGLLRGSAAIRYGGLALFGLSLAKIFLYDLAELSSVARAFSFILVGGLLLAGGFFLQRLSDRIGPRHP